MTFDIAKARQYVDQLNLLSENNFERRIIIDFVNQCIAKSIYNNYKLDNPLCVSYVPPKCEVYIKSFLMEMGYEPQDIQFLSDRTIIWF